MSDSDHLYVLNDPKYKKRIRAILTERSLTSYMSDTKWRELRRVIDELPFPPAYQIKRVDADLPEPLELNYAPTSFGDWGRTWEAGLGIHIEWMRIVPRYSRYRGRLVSPEIQDCSSELLAPLRRLRFPFVEQGGFVMLYGHGSGVDFDL